MTQEGASMLFGLNREETTEPFPNYNNQTAAQGNYKLESGYESDQGRNRQRVEAGLGYKVQPGLRCHIMTSQWTQYHLATVRGRRRNLQVYYNVKYHRT